MTESGSWVPAPQLQQLQRPLRPHVWRGVRSVTVPARPRGRGLPELQGAISPTLGANEAAPRSPQVLSQREGPGRLRKNLPVGTPAFSRAHTVRTKEPCQPRHRHSASRRRSGAVTPSPPGEPKSLPRAACWGGGRGLPSPCFVHLGWPLWTSPSCEQEQLCEHKAVKSPSLWGQQSVIQPPH